MQGLVALVAAQISYYIAKIVADIICIYGFMRKNFTDGFYGGRIIENSKIKGDMHLIAFSD